MTPETLPVPAARRGPVWTRLIAKPFASQILETPHEPGQSLGAMVAHLVRFGDLDPADLPRLVIYQDGERLEGERSGHMALVPPAGTVLTLQVEPGAAAIGTLMAKALFFIGAPMAFIGAAYIVTVTAVGIAAQFALAYGVNLLLAPDKPELLANATKQASLRGTTNPLRLRQMMPLVLGSGRVNFDAAALSYTQFLGGEVWLTVIFGLHYGPCDLTGVKIGETLLSAWPSDEVRVEYALTPGPRAFGLYNRLVEQQDLSDKLDLGYTNATLGTWETYTTPDNARQVEVDVVSPAGMFVSNDDGGFNTHSLYIDAEWKPIVGGSWAPIPWAGGPFSGEDGTLTTGRWQQSGRTRDPIRTTRIWQRSSDEAVQIRIRGSIRSYSHPAERVTNDTYVTAIRAVSPGAPVLDQTLACMALMIKASDDLNGSLPVVTGVVTPHAPVWDGTDWADDVGDWGPSANLIAQARGLLVGPARQTPFEAGLLGDPSWGEAYELNEARGWTACSLIATNTSLAEALGAFEAMGRFRIHHAGDRIVITSDWTKPVPVALFNGRNMSGYRYSRSFAPDVHAISVEFQNLEADSEADEVLVYAPGYDATNAELIEAVTYPWALTPERAIREGRVLMTRRLAPVETHQWTAGPDGLATAFGSRVLLAHPSSMFGVVSARVQQRITTADASSVLGLRLDAEITMTAGQSWRLDARRTGDVLRGLVLTTVAGTSREVMFATPMSPTGSPQAGDLVEAGLVNEVTEDLEIIDHQPQADGSVSITARRYLGAEIAAAELGSVTVPASGLTPRPRAPTPRFLALTRAGPEGVIVPFDVVAPRGGAIAGFVARWRLTAQSGQPVQGWQALPDLSASSRVLVTPPLGTGTSPASGSSEVRVDIDLRSRLTSGDLSQGAVLTSVLVQRAVLAPAGGTVSAAIRTGTDGSTYPVIAVAATPVTAGQVQLLMIEYREVGTTPWRFGGTVAASTGTADVRGVEAGRTYEVRLQHRDLDGWPSAWVVLGGTAAVPLRSDVSASSGNLGAGGTLGSGANQYEPGAAIREISVQDGVAVSFSPAYPTPPRITITDEGAAPLASGEIYYRQASGLSGSGFTPVIKRRTPAAGTPTATTDGPATAGSGAESLEVQKGQTQDSSNGIYSFRAKGQIFTTKIGEEWVDVEGSGGGVIDILSGFIELGFYSRSTGGGAWTERGRLLIGGTYMYAGEFAVGSNAYDRSINLSIPDAIGQHGSTEWRCAVLGRGHSSTQDRLDWFAVSYSYLASGSPTDRSATPSGEVVRCFVQPLVVSA